MRRWFTGGDRTLWLFVGAVTASASVLLGFLAARGSWYADDLDFLIHGARGFGIANLLAPVNDHIAPGLRLTYAVFAAVAPLNYGFTVVVRALLWAVAVGLMAALVHRVFRDARATALGTLVYAFSPLAMPSFMSLSSAVNNLPAHVLGLISLHYALDWFERRRWVALAGGAIALLGSMLFWEKSALVLATGLALGLMRVSQSSRTRRLLGWLLTQMGALAAFGIFYLARSNSNGGAFPPASTVVRLVVESLRRSVLPWFAGGPWAWQPSSPPYFGFAAPPPVVVGIGIGVVTLCLAVCWRRARPALWLWGALAAYLVLTVFAVAYGRFATFGETLTMHYHYWSDASIPMSLAVAGTVAAVRHLPSRWPVAAGALITAGWVVVAAGSYVGFAELWGRNPSGAYVSRLASALAERGGTNLWDTAPPSDVMPAISNNRRVSGLAQLLGADAQFGQIGSEPYLVADDGSVVPSRFVEWGSAIVPAKCDLTLHRHQTVAVPLSGTLPAGRWFARMDYLANPQAEVLVELRARDGATTALRSGSTPWPAGLSTAYLAADDEGAGSEIVLTTGDKETNVCIGSISIGLVEPAP